MPTGFKINPSCATAWLQCRSTSLSMRSWVVVVFFLTNLVESFHVNTFNRQIIFRRTRLAAHPSARAISMGTSSLPTLESLRKTGLMTIAALVIGSSPLHAFAASIPAVAEELTAENPATVQELSPAEMLVKKTTEIQRKRLKEEEQQQLQGDVDMAEGDLIARVRVSIKADLYELGAPDVSGFPGLDTDDARLIVAAFGKDGPPVAAKRLTIKGRPFPVIVELTVNDLAFPLTKDAWKQDGRSLEDIGLAVEIDPDGKAATLDSGSLTGYGVSKPLRIGAQMERTEATIELIPNPQLQERAEQTLPPEGLEQLERVDAMLDYKEEQASKGIAAA